MIGVRLVAGSLLSLRHNSVPLIPGNIRSRIINEGGSFSLRAAVNPTSPVAAVTVTKPSRSKLYFKLSEMSGSSSMIRIGRCISYVGQAFLPVSVFDQKSRQTGMSVLLVVLDECGFSHVNSQLANVGHVIADTFEVLGYENQARIARRRGRFGHHHLNQTMKNVVIEIVDH